MRVLLDACVLYPTVMREVLMGVAARGLFTPMWSSRILEEWARAVARNLPAQEGVARAEIALLRARWQKAAVTWLPEIAENLYLPDPDDVHVLAAAIAGEADVLLTMNLRDFPTRALAAHTILRRDPDGFLRDIWQDNPEQVALVCEAVRDQAQLLSGQPQPMRALLKKARLPKLAKAITA